MVDDYNFKEDYRSVSIPDDKDKEEYSPYERRAELYRRVRESGFGGLDTYSSLADEFGVSSSQINKDINDELRPFIVEVEFNQKQVKSSVASAMERAMELAQESGDADDIRKVAKDYMKIMQSVGAVEEEPDKVEVDADVNVSDSLRESFSKYHGDSDDQADGVDDSVDEDSQSTE